MKIVETSDKARRDKILAAISKNQGYCPCRLIKTDDTECLCKEFREQTTEGPCHCGLYIKVKEDSDNE